MKKNIDQLKMKRETKFQFTETLEDILIEGAVVPKVDVDYLLELVEGEVIIRGEYTAFVKTNCVRCLEEIEVKVSGEFFGDYKETKDYDEYIESLGKEAQVLDDMVEELVDGEVDISSLVRDYIILDMPQFPACEPECGGLEELEKYRDSGIDSRWQKLLDLKN
ncbi:YceD family protein [Fusobacteria bacterium ZRK30]|nr:YceD family protein [Fusobacteria bacterium ZRK30]